MVTVNADGDQNKEKTFLFRCADSDCGERFDFSSNPRSQNKPVKKRFDFLAKTRGKNKTVSKNYCPYCGSCIDGRDQDCPECGGKLTVIDPTIVKFCLSCGSYLELINISG